MARIYIDRYTGRLSREDLYYVTLTLKDGTVIEHLEPRRLFPLSRAQSYITLLDKNEKEIAFVRELAELDDDSAKALLDCFAEFYHIPKIKQLLTCEDKFGTRTWRAETDCGTVTFRIRNRHSDIKSSPEGRVLIRDSNDNRYEIPDANALDPHSRRILFSYI